MKNSPSSYAWLALIAVCVATNLSVVLSAMGNYVGAAGWWLLAVLQIHTYEGSLLMDEILKIAEESNQGWAQSLAKYRELLEEEWKEAITKDLAVKDTR